MVHPQRVCVPKSRSPATANWTDDPRLDAGMGLGSRVWGYPLLPGCQGASCAGILAGHEILVAAQRGDHRHTAGLHAHP